MSESERILIEIEICRMQKAAKDFAKMGKLVKSLDKLFFVEFFKDELEEDAKD
jgi:hypothetical protein